MRRLNGLKAIAALSMLGLLSPPAMSVAQPMEAASAASDAAEVAAAAVNMGGIELRSAPPGPDTKYRVLFQADGAQAGSLIAEHKQLCEAMGAARCQVEEFMPEPNGYDSEGLTLRLRLAAGTAPAMIASLGKQRGTVGFRVEQDSSERGPENNRAEWTVRRALLIAQRETLGALQRSAPADQQSAISSQFSNIQSQLAQVDAQLAAAVAKPRADVLLVRYGDRPASQRSRTWRDLDEIFGNLVKGLLIVTGVALLTVLYFAIIGLGFLWARRFARRRGLIGSAVMSEQTPVP